MVWNVREGKGIFLEIGGGGGRRGDKEKEKPGHFHLHRRGTSLCSQRLGGLSKFHQEQPQH